MKKIVPLTLILLLVGCNHPMYTPVGPYGVSYESIQGVWVGSVSFPAPVTEGPGGPSGPVVGDNSVTLTVNITSNVVRVTRTGVHFGEYQSKVDIKHNIVSWRNGASGFMGVVEGNRISGNYWNGESSFQIELSGPYLEGNIRTMY